MSEKDIIMTKLKENSDAEYRLFQAKLMPTVDPDTILGVRIPAIRKLAKEVAKTDAAKDFLCSLPHKTYDENNLHALLISEIKEYRETVVALDAFLPYVDNWATCDIMSPKAFKKNREKLIVDIKRWMSSDRVYTVRFGIEMLMSHFLDEDFKIEYLEWVAEIKSSEYYVNMMIAWYFATALAKQWDVAIKYIETGRFDKWVNNKTIRKAIESYRITDSQKALLRGYIIK